jgi:hypothetical protein
MSVDIVGAVNIVTTVVIVAILIVGVYRALEMRKVFVNLAYRSRATWSAFLMLVILILMLTNFIAIPSTGFLSAIEGLFFFVVIFTFFSYADRSVLVAMEADFFHRDTLGWLRIRWAAAVGLLAFVAVEIGAPSIGNPTAQEQLLENALSELFFVVFAVVLAYVAAALIIGARRSADRNLRRSILLLGLALSTLVLSILVTNFLSEGTLPYAIVNKGTGVVGIYLIYRSVMSLSPLGRVQKDVGATKNGENRVVSGHP